MASDDYSEDNNIQEPVARMFEEHLDWRSVYAFNAETFGLNSLLGRKNASEVVLVRELDAALSKLNPKLTASAEGRTQLVLARDLLLDGDPTKTQLQHNQAKWKLLRDGITLKALGGRGEHDVHITVIDFKTPSLPDSTSASPDFNLEIALLTPMN
jgi:type I restriction enzyme R subunit